MNTIIKKISFLFDKLLHDRRQLMCSFITLFMTWLPDKLYLKLLFYFRLGYWMDFDDPRSYCEKMQWLKLYNQKADYVTLVDKYKVKDYVSNKIGSEYVIKTFGVWNRSEDIEWDILPQKFVLKTTNGGGGTGVVICNDKYNLNKRETIEKLNLSLKQDIYKKLKEWPYKYVSHQIIAEELLEERGQKSPHDYKVMCFDGKVKLIEFHEGRYTDHHTQDFYDTE